MLTINILSMSSTRKEFRAQLIQAVFVEQLPEGHHQPLEPFSLYFAVFLVPRSPLLWAGSVWAPPNDILKEIFLPTTK